MRYSHEEASSTRGLIMNQAETKRPTRQDGAPSEPCSHIVATDNSIGKITAKINPNYSSNIPTKFLIAFERELSGVWHGFVTLKVCLRNGRYVYSKIIKEVDAGTEGAGYSGYILPAAIKDFEKAAAELSHGTVTLTFFIRAGILFRYEIDPKRSVLVEGFNDPEHLMAGSYVC